eukprot:gene34445-42482_t
MAAAGAPMVGGTIAALRASAPDVAVRLVAIYRRFPDEPDRFVACAGNTRIEPGDEVFVLAAQEHIAHVLSALHRRDARHAHPVRRIMIAGGGRVGLRLAQQLGQQEGRFHLKVIESDPQRCVELASVLPHDVLVVLLATLMRGYANDVYFQVGLITIIGLSAKNAILIIEFAKDLQAQGKGVIESALEAAHLRFRPIIMTSMAFGLGVVPLAIASGAGSASQRAIGTGVLGGMFTGTVLAVFFVPVFFVVVRGLFKGSARQQEMNRRHAEEAGIGNHD